MHGSETLTFRSSRTARITSWTGGILLTVGSCVLVYYALLRFATHEDPGVVGLLAFLTVFCGYLAAWSLRFVLRGAELVTISKKGIDEKQFGFGLIEWPCMQGVESVERFKNGTTFRTLYL